MLISYARISKADGSQVLDLRSYEGLVRETQFGSVVVPGDVFLSNLVRIVQGHLVSHVRRILC